VVKRCGESVISTLKTRKGNAPPRGSAPSAFCRQNHGRVLATTPSTVAATPIKTRRSNFKSLRLCKTHAHPPLSNRTQHHPSRPSSLVVVLVAVKNEMLVLLRMRRNQKEENKIGSRPGNLETPKSMRMGAARPWPGATSGSRIGAAPGWGSGQ
jgi:hypothetical protein